MGVRAGGLTVPLPPELGNVREPRLRVSGCSPLRIPGLRVSFGLFCVPSLSGTIGHLTWASVRCLRASFQNKYRRFWEQGQLEALFSNSGARFEWIGRHGRTTTCGGRIQNSLPSLSVSLPESLELIGRAELLFPIPTCAVVLLVFSKFLLLGKLAHLTLDYLIVMFVVYLIVDATEPSDWRIFPEIVLSVWQNLRKM